MFICGLPRCMCVCVYDVLILCLEVWRARVWSLVRDFSLLLAATYSLDVFGASEIVSSLRYCGTLVDPLCVYWFYVVLIKEG